MIEYSAKLPAANSVLIARCTIHAHPVKRQVFAFYDVVVSKKIRDNVYYRP